MPELLTLLLSISLLSFQVCVKDMHHDFIRELPLDKLLILSKFTSAVKKDLKDGTQEAQSSGWVFSCRRLVENFLSVLRCTQGRHLYVSCDGTYKLLANGWVLLNMISETIIDSSGGMCCNIT